MCCNSFVLFFDVRFYQFFHGIGLCASFVNALLREFLPKVCFNDNEETDLTFGRCHNRGKKIHLLMVTGGLQASQRSIHFVQLVSHRNCDK